MKHLKIRSLLLAALLLSFTSSWAGELPQPKGSYLVKTADEFNEAAKHAQPGEEIVLAKGNWSDMELKVKANGQEGNMIYIRGEAPGETIIDGTTQIRIGGDYIYMYNLSFAGCVATSPKQKGAIILFRADSEDESHHSVLSDCHFDSCVPEDKSFDDVWVNLYGTHNTVQRCYFGGKDNKGLYIVVWHRNDKADYHTIRQNYFYRPESVNNGENGQEIIRIGDSNNSLTDASCIIEDNFFYRCNGEVEILSIKSGDNTIRRNTFVECQGAVTLRHGNYNTVEGNFFLANGVEEAGGVRVINKGHKVYNNYFYGHVADRTRTPISIMRGVENGALNTYNQVEDAEIYNNTMVNCKNNFSFSVVGKNTTLHPINTTIGSTIVVTDRCDIDELIDDNGGDVSGITFVDCHLEGRDGVAKGKGYIESKYDSEEMTIAGVTFPLIRAKSKAQSPSFIATDIAGKSRKGDSPIGASSSFKATKAAKIATPDNCGPTTWSGWNKPL
ncbi:MAG: polysaccharide lyase 6 family protein [Rikenellaceae bacterium]